LPDNRDDLIGVVAASSITQKQLSEVRKGTYEVTGEVVSASTIDGYGSQGVVVLAYDLEKTGTLESASVSDLVTQESTGLSAVLERQANPTQDVSTITQSGEDTVEAAGESGNESTDEVTSEDGSDDAAGTADESDNESTGEDTDQEDSEAASETSNGTETQSESSAEETENTESSESTTTQSTEPDEGNGIMGSVSELIQLFTDLFS
jgi:cobalamin biosynthesis protein CobT